MKSYDVVIVGAGLAGLYAARALSAAGVDFIVIEARDRIGGRILAVDGSGKPTDDGFDLGPSWYWPEMQPAMAELVSEVGLQSFPQNSEGDVVFERMSRETPQRYRPTMQEQQSMRISGGTGAGVSAIARELPSDRVLLGTRVTAMELVDVGVRIAVQRGDASEKVKEAGYVIAALPPRLLEAAVSFTPSQESATSRRWRDTPTWMAPHAKFFAIYDQPFWRASGLSGTAQSMVGPMVEIHDATTASGKAALFGFLGVAAEQRAAAGEDALKTACLAQLERLFGPQARNVTATLLKDWAADPLTATAHDLVASSHPVVQDDAWVTGTWQGRLSLAGSETSDSEPGYLSGAVTAARRAVANYLSR
ncbi:NAD(P)-binding protein [Shinella kummerowiae]|uniref:NAD(P)-binding protein n=1 Tax=Shinella kummerowiae TaxID=417745 RepID=A0A6N8S9F5_9HYPH|nr:FAD-dependent oxidoreductase [Shinella kummerowiae]MXN45704.1 NAD(P)-binding protein [Shinella kummerowiae]